MPRLVASLLVLALGTAAIALASCGEEDAQLLPGGTAREITANLDTVKLLADEGDCVGAESAALQVSEQVEAIEGVDERLKRALREGAARLNEVVADCEEEIEMLPEVTTTEVEPPIPDEDDKEKKDKKDEDDDGEDEGEDEQADEEAKEVEETEPALPPQAEGEGKGVENGNGPSGGEGGSSGGLSPGSPAGEGD